MLGMGRYVDVAGHPTWVEEFGEGPATVMLLHGGFGNSDDLISAIGGALADVYRIVAFDRRGHGRTADTGAPFHYGDMATETAAVLDEVVGGPAHLVGFSDGGIISLLVSQRRPDLVMRQVLIGTNYHHGGFRSLELDPDSPVGRALLAEYVERSPDGADHFEVVFEKGLTLIASEPTLTVDDLRTVSAPTLVMVGDDDMVELSHTMSLYEALPAGQLAVVPRASHLVYLDAPTDVARLVLEFLAADEPPTTMMPSRRSRG